MKKTILTLILFITTLTVTFSQETQSDATLDETINWINEIAMPKQGYSEEYSVTNIYVDINEEKIIYFMTYNGESDDPVTAKFNEHYLIDVGYYDNNFEIIINVDDYPSIIIRYSDKEMARRTYNAFSHLFKLLNIEVKRYNKLANENKF